MASSEVRLERWDEIHRETVTDDIARRIFTGERIMLTQVYLDEGAVVPMHSHENEQLSWILEGRLRFTIGEGGPEGAREIIVSEGEVLFIPSNVPHKAEALADTVDVDIFSPPRQDWLDGTDTYFHDR